MSDLISDMRGDSTPVYLTTKADVVDYYKEHYSEKQWRPRLADALTEHSSVKRSSILRSLQGGREYKAAKGDKASEFKKIGESLPPLRYDPPSGGFLLDFVASVKISGGECEERQFSVTLTATDAFDMLNNDEEVDYLSLVHRYFPDGLVEEVCGEPSVTVTPLSGNGKRVASGHAEDDDDSFYDDDPFEGE